jgi:dihydroorotase
VRQAKAEGLPVTADVSINSLHLTDADMGYFDSRARLTPVLRQQQDRDALRAGLADGTLEALVSDHTPVDADAKALPFAEAEPGATGMELLWSLALKWGQSEGLDLSAVLSRITSQPARVLGASLRDLQGSVGQLRVGGVADVSVLSTEGHWPVTEASLRSQGKSTPFSGYELPGRVLATLVAGHVAFEA